MQYSNILNGSGNPFHYCIRINSLFCLDDFCFASIGSLNDHKLPETKKTQCNIKNENCKVIDCADGKCEVTDISYHNDASDNCHTQIKLDQHSGEGFTELSSRSLMFSGQHSIKRNAERS